MSKSEAAKVAGRLQKDASVWRDDDRIDELAEQVAKLATELARLTDAPRPEAPLHQLADEAQVLSEIAELEQQLAEARKDLAQSHSAYNAQALELAELKAANEDLSDRLVAVEGADGTADSRVKELERELQGAILDRDQRAAEMNEAHSRIDQLEREVDTLRAGLAKTSEQRDEREVWLQDASNLLREAYVAREVPWSDVAAGMMTIARDGTPWMVVEVDEASGTYVLQNGAKPFAKHPAEGETVRVLEPYVTPEQAEALVASELGGRA